jgi:hypothetical protein
MKKRTKVILLLVAALILCYVGYFALPIGCLFYSMHSQMRTGQRYLDSITEKDIPAWIERTEKYLKEYDPNSTTVGVYGTKDRPIPNELRALKILRIDISQDSVYYVWLGGLDHTYLEVQKNNHGDFKFIGNYNDYSSKVIWPKEDANQTLQSNTGKPRGQ